MTEITGTTTTGTTTNTVANTTSSVTDADAIGEQFDTFLRLLTAQIQNQDPLAPMDSTQFVEQLATFSGLEQQVETNQSLGNIASMIGDLHTIIANEWLGQEVAVASSHVAYEGDPIEFEINPSLAHDSAQFSVINDQGEVIWQETLDPSTDRYNWNGQVTGESTPAPTGVYRFQIDLFQGDQVIAQTEAEIVSKVTTLGSEDGKLVLGTDNYLSADLSTTRKLTSN